VSHGVTLIVKGLRLSLLICVFAGAPLAEALAQSIAIEVVSAEATHDAQTGKPVVAYRMSAASTRAFFDLTKNNIGRKAAVMIDGRVMVEPLILAAMMSPYSQISGDFDIEEARSIARRLSDGTAKLTIGIASDGGRGKQ